MRRAASTRAWLACTAARASLGRGLGGLLHLAGGGILLGGLGRGGFQFGDRLGALVDIGPQPAPFGQRRNRGGVRRIRGGGDHLRLLELAGERGDGVGRGPRRGEPLGCLRALAGEPSQVFGQRRMPADRIVDLGDRGGAPGHLVVGGTQPADRGWPTPRSDGRWG